MLKNITFAFFLFCLFLTPQIAGAEDTSSINTIIEKADAGDVIYQSALGKKYFQGNGVPRNFAKAAEWFGKAAKQGDAYAQYVLGMQYTLGKGVPQDYAKAVELYHKAAEQEHPKAQYILGVMYQEGKGLPQDYVKGVELYRKAAEQGDLEAQYLLGRAYLAGEGVSKDYKKSFKWLRKSAEQGHIESQGLLGAFYAKGQGVSKDNKKAIKWYKKAAEQGDLKAQYLLGIAYAKGKGVSKDYSKSIKLFRKGAERGHKDSQQSLAFSYALGLGAPIDHKKCFLWASISEANGVKKVAPVKDSCANQLSSEELSHAKELIKEKSLGNVTGSAETNKLTLAIKDIENQNHDTYKSKKRRDDRKPTGEYFYEFGDPETPSRPPSHNPLNSFLAKFFDWAANYFGLIILLSGIGALISWSLYYDSKYGPAEATKEKGHDVGSQYLKKNNTKGQGDKDSIELYVDFRESVSKLIEKVKQDFSLTNFLLVCILLALVFIGLNLL